MSFFKTVDHLPEGVLRFPDKVLSFIWFFVRQMKTPFYAITVFYAISNVLVALRPYFIGLIVEKLEGFDFSVHQFGDVLLWPVITFFLLCFVLQAICVQSGSYIQTRTISVFASMMRRQLSLYLHGQSYSFFQSDFSGRLAGKIVETPSAVHRVVFTVIGPFLFAFVSFVVGIILFASVSVTFLIISVCWLAAYAALLYYFVPQVMKLSQKASTSRGFVRGAVVDAFTNIVTVKLFSRQKFEDSFLRKKLKVTAQEFQDVDMKIWHFRNCLETLLIILWALVIGFTIWGWMNQEITTGQVAMIFPLTLNVATVSWWLSEMFTGFFQFLGEIEEGMEAINKPYDLIDAKNAKKLKIGKAAIHCENLNFSYDNKQVFDALDLNITPGQKLGLVGPSGAGKSSLVSLLLRFYDLQSGAITIDGQDISKVTQDSLRSQIAVIPQDISLFHRSLLDNIRYGRLDATDEEIIAAAKKAHAHDFIADLPEGYDTLVGERGVKLSGGQRQRIAIARAILKDAPILILDEATSALDSESERLIQDSLKTLMEGKTVIAIAHRLSTIAHLDRLIVMHEGEIVEDGSHDDLLNIKNGHYAKLWAMQSGGFLKE